MNYGSSDCPDCRQTTSGNCGKHGNVVVIEGGSTLPLLAERQYCYDRIAALIAERDAALQRAEQAEAALAAVERQTQAEIVRVVEERDAFQHERDLERDETTDLRAALAQAQAAIAEIEDIVINGDDPAALREAIDRSRLPGVAQPIDWIAERQADAANAQPPALPPCSVCGRPTGGCCTVTRPTTTFPLTGRPGEAAHLKLKE